MKMEAGNSFKNWKIFLIILGIVFLTLLPGTHTDFAHHDDYQVFDHSPDTSRDAVLFDLLVRLGRPITAYLINFENYLINNQIHRTHLIRYAGMVFVVISAFLFYQYSKILSLNERDSLLLVLGMFLMPPFVYCVIAINSFCALLSCFLSILSFFAGLQAGSKEKSKNYRIVFFILALAIFLLSLLTYPAFSMFYWAMLGALIAVQDKASWESWKSRIYCLLAIGSSSMILYKIYLFWSVYYFGDHCNATYCISQVVSPIDNIKFFIDHVLLRASNLWNIYPTKEFALVVFGVILSGVFLEIIIGINKKPKEESKGSLAVFLFQKLIGLGGMIPLSATPSLLSTYHMDTYRTLGPLMALICILLFWSVGNIVCFVPKRVQSKLKTAVLTIFCVASIHQANQNTTLQAFGDTIEYRFVKANLRQNLSSLKDYKNIHVIFGSYAALITPKHPVVDEFFFPTSRHGNSRYMVVGAMKELGFDQILETWEITVGSEDISDPETPTLFIDFNQIKYFY